MKDTINFNTYKTMALGYSNSISNVNGIYERFYRDESK